MLQAFLLMTWNRFWPFVAPVGVKILTEMVWALRLPSKKAKNKRGKQAKSTWQRIRTRVLKASERILWQMWKLRSRPQCVRLRPPRPWLHHLYSSIHTATLTTSQSLYILYVHTHTHRTTEEKLRSGGQSWLEHCNFLHFLPVVLSLCVYHNTRLQHKRL